MKDNVLFLNMFALYQPQEPLGQLLLDAQLISADIDQMNRRITARIHASKYIPKRLLNQVETEIGEVYGLSRMEISPVYPAEELHNMEQEDLLNLFVSVNSMARGSLAGAKWLWEDRTLTIDLLANGKSILEEAFARRNLPIATIVL